MSKYYIEYGALQANGKRLIECETSALEARKITEEFAREIADALNGREAWKQEKAEIEADALSVGGIVEAARHKPVGNAAAMREALLRCEAISCLPEIREQQCVRDMRNIIADALSAPARNCDLYASATEALKAQDVAFNEDNFKNGECKLGCPGCDDGLIDCKILWLFATAKERKGPGK